MVSLRVTPFGLVASNGVGLRGPAVWLAVWPAVWLAGWRAGGLSVWPAQALWPAGWLAGWPSGGVLGVS